jgi:hypothetical protein
MDSQLPDLREVNHLAAARAVRALPDDADLRTLRAQEERREKGARPSVLRAIDERLGSAARDELPEAQWEEVNWKRSATPLYKCRSCSFQTFTIGLAFEHARTAHT